VRRYVSLIVFPERQAIFHAVPLTTWRDPRAYGSIAIIVAMLALSWRLRHTDSPVSLGLLWFLAILVPPAVLVLLNRAEPMAEHRVYIAAAGLFVAAGTFIGWLMAHARAVSPRVRSALTAVFVTVLLSLSGRTMLRNAIWGNAVGLWEEARDLAPDHWLPHLLLGEALHADGRHFEAAAEYNEALKRRPEEELAYRKLGLCLIEMQQLDAANDLFERLRSRAPKSVSASLGLGAVAMARGNQDAARSYFLEALGHDARNVTARQSLALLDEAEPTNPVEALMLCQQIRQLAPNTPGNDECIARNEARVKAGAR
jgi:Flp pilus assembly protein TadD